MRQNAGGPGERENVTPNRHTMKNKAAQELGRLGGKARAAKMTPEERSELARELVKAREAKRKEKARSKRD